MNAFDRTYVQITDETREALREFQHNAHGVGPVAASPLTRATVKNARACLTRTILAAMRLDELLPVNLPEIDDTSPLTPPEKWIIRQAVEAKNGVWSTALDSHIGVEWASSLARKGYGVHYEDGGERWFVLNMAGLDMLAQILERAGASPG